jgi:hypothetical protein
MSDRINAELLENIVATLAARDWSARYLSVLIKDEGSGAVTGAQEHFAALRMLSCQTLGDMPVPARFCNPDELNE